jgi:hypothetical protein
MDNDITPQEWAAMVEAAREKWESVIEDMGVDQWRNAMVRLQAERVRMQSTSRLIVLWWHLQRWTDTFSRRLSAIGHTVRGHR